MERVKRLLQSEKPVTWIFYGDSITHGALHTSGYRDYVEIFAERIRYELGLTRQTIINSAISGDTSQGLVTGFDWRVARFNPDVVPVMIGQQLQIHPGAKRHGKADVHLAAQTLHARVAERPHQAAQGRVHLERPARLPLAVGLHVEGHAS